MPCSSSVSPKKKKKKNYYNVIRKDTHHNARDEPDKGGDESESLSGLPATTRVTAQEAIPVPDASTVELMNGVDEDTESSEPGEGENNVDYSGAQISTLHSVDGF